MEVSRFKKLLKDNGHFITKPRLRLFAILQRRPALTMQELIPLVDQHDQVTVYRNIDLFEKLGIINRLRLGWLTKIELSDIFVHHHHHFTCTNCGKIFDLPDDPIIEKQISQLALGKNFHATDHQLEIRGLCRDCQKNELQSD
jgi:Fur family zinc uptake transcriptional regulator